MSQTIGWMDKKTFNRVIKGERNEVINGWKIKEPKEPMFFEYKYESYAMILEHEDKFYRLWWST